MIVMWIEKKKNHDFTEKCTENKKRNAMEMYLDSIEDSVTIVYAENEKGDIFTAIVTKELWIALKGNDRVIANISEYKENTIDESEGIIFLVAVVTLMVGAYWSAESERNYLYQALSTSSGELRRTSSNDRENVSYITIPMAFFFVFMSSVSLLVLFFFMSSLIIVLIFLFAFGGAITLMICVYSLCRFVPYLSRLDYEFTALGSTWNALALAALVPSVIVSATWFFFRHENWSWCLQDLIAISFVLHLLCSVRLPNIKVSCVLLILLFLYDIFWVFLSGYFFKTSVMVHVATAANGSMGETMPMLIRIPKWKNALGGFSLLGLGDIALPGVFVAFLLRFDYIINKQLKWNSYFVISSIGYMVGLGLTFFALHWMKVGQPALLYIVPCMLIPVCMFAAWRGEFGLMWIGRDLSRHLNGFSTAELSSFTPIPGEPSARSLIFDVGENLPHPLNKRYVLRNSSELKES